MMFRLRTLLLATLVLPLGPLAAQEVPQVSPTPAATPTPTPQASPTPTAPIIVSPMPTPTPRVLPTSGATPTPRAVEAPVPRPTPTPVPRAAPSTAPAPPPSASPQPVPTVEPSPIATVDAPPVIASPLPTTDERTADETPAWPWMLGAGALLVAGIGVWLARRQRTPEDEEIGVATDADEPEAIVPPASMSAAPAASAAAAGLALRFRPTRVGFNMLSATAEGELTIANEGSAPVDDLRVRTALLGAHVEQDADLAAFLAEPIGRPAVPPFALAPGEERTVRVLAAAPRATLRTMTAAGRPMFVPVLAVNVLSGGTQVAQAFAIGAERVDSAKLAPFWLDVPDRAYSEVAARPHGPAVTRRG